jgi:cytochrome c peroxidase
VTSPRASFAVAGALGVVVALAIFIRALGSADVPEVAMSAPPGAAPESDERALSRSIQPLSRPRGGDVRKIALGRRLFNEAALSDDGSTSCASCHHLDHGGADARAVAIGVRGALGTVNTPTVFNADFNVKQFWDGRADTLEAQVDGPLNNPLEMASSWPRAVATLRANASYTGAFGEIYPQGVTPDTVADAVASFERTLVSDDGRFDRYLNGDATALTPLEHEGFLLFERYGCVSCHQGQNVGGNLFEKMGVMSDYFAQRGGPVLPSDLGRYNVTKREEDRFKFRVPSLRLASRTAPYFHDGRAETLERAVVLMGRFQLAQEIPPRDVEAIVAFLGSLSGAEAAEHAFR